MEAEHGITKQAQSGGVREVGKNTRRGTTCFGSKPRTGQENNKPVWEELQKERYKTRSAISCCRSKPLPGQITHPRRSCAGNAAAHGAPFRATGLSSNLDKNSTIRSVKMCIMKPTADAAKLIDGATGQPRYTNHLHQSQTQQMPSTPPY